MERSRIQSRGFSLVEMVVYVSVLIFMLFILVEVVTSFVRSERLIRTSRDIDNSALVSLERIGREVRRANSINVASSTLLSSPGVLVLSGEDGEGNLRMVEFFLSNSSLRYKENGVDLGPLTSSSTRVTNLVFRRFATSTGSGQGTSISEGVRVELRLEGGTTTSYKTENFYSTALIR